jgi:hypothetical protein
MEHRGDSVGVAVSAGVALDRAASHMAAVAP